MDTVTSFVEHPESVAKRIVRYAKRVGRENVIAAPDCGFGTFGGWNPESTPRSCGPSSARWSRVPESQRRNSGAKPARRSCTHLYPPISFSYPLHNVAFSLALISPRMPHTMIKSTGSTIRLPVPLQPGRVRATTPVPRYKRWRLLTVNQPLVRVTARETSPLLRITQEDRSDICVYLRPFAANRLQN